MSHLMTCKACQTLDKERVSYADTSLFLHGSHWINTNVEPYTGRE